MTANEQSTVVASCLRVFCDMLTVVLRPRLCKVIFFRVLRAYDCTRDPPFIWGSHGRGMTRNGKGQKTTGRLAKCLPRSGSPFQEWQARGARRDRTLYADSPPPPRSLPELAGKCRTMGTKGTLRKIRLN